MKENKGLVYFKQSILDEENDYEIDCVDLSKFDGKKISSESMSCISLPENMLTPISDSYGSSNMSISYTLNYDDELTITGTVYKKEDELFKESLTIDNEVFVNQLYDSIYNKKNKAFSVNKIQEVNTKLQTIKDTLYSKAFDNSLLLTDEEYNYKINIYAPNTNNLIGVANRLSIKLNVLYLMEIVVFETSTSLNKIDIEMVIDEHTAIMFKDLSLAAESGKSIKYCTYSLDGVKVKKNYANDSNPYDPTKMKCKSIAIPSTKISNLSTKQLSDELIRMNEQNTLLKFYKQNKKMNILTVDINRFLLT